MSSLRLRYTTVELGEHDIHVRILRDRQQFLDVDGAAEKLGISSANWPLFGQLWPAGRVLARIACQLDIRDRRVLEVGCGIGLASLVLNRRGADITATDEHPEAGAFLRYNAMLNGDAAIPFVRTGWADGGAELGRFDLILGSDLLYDHAQVQALASFIDRHAAPGGEVIVVDPGRGLQNRFSRHLASLGYRQLADLPIPGGDELPAPDFKGRALHYRGPAAAAGPDGVCQACATN